MESKHADIQNTRANLDTLHDWRQLTFSHPERAIRLGTTFSGIGAIEHAFRRLGLRHEIQFAGDIDPECRRAYFANYPISEKQWHTDIHTFDATPYRGQIDLLVGGAPCQAFSARGKRGGFSDTRGTLFREFARVVIECQPKVFIFENVRGLLTHDKGNTWNVVKSTFERDCGYDVHFQVLNSRDYGVPQCRERVYCIGFRQPTAFQYPAPVPLTKSLYDCLQATVDRKYLLKEKGVRFVTRSLNVTKGYTQVNGEVIHCQRRNQQFNWHGDFVFHPKAACDSRTPDTDPTLFRVSDFEETAYSTMQPEKYAITDDGNRLLSMSPKSGSDIDPRFGRYRKLTPRECLRLMGFDDTFRIECSDTETYKQAGNSIVVDVLIAILREMDITQYGV